jgi:hypothetical protein
LETDDRGERRSNSVDDLVIPEEDENNLTESEVGSRHKSLRSRSSLAPSRDRNEFSDSQASLTLFRDAGRADEALRRRSSSRSHDEGTQRMSLSTRPISRNGESNGYSPEDATRELATLRVDSRTSTSLGRQSPATSNRFSNSNIGPPSILTSSEFGARWLREQSERLKKRVGPGSSNGGSLSGGRSMDDDLGSDDDEVSMYEEGRGDLALVRDRRGSTCIPALSSATS